MKTVHMNSLTYDNWTQQKQLAVVQTQLASSLPKRLTTRADLFQASFSARSTRLPSRSQFCTQPHDS